MSREYTQQRHSIVIAAYFDVLAELKQVVVGGEICDMSESILFKQKCSMISRRIRMYHSGSIGRILTQYNKRCSTAEYKERLQAATEKLLVRMQPS